jgi:hypothetical protein
MLHVTAILVVLPLSNHACRVRAPPDPNWLNVFQMSILWSSSDQGGAGCAVNDLHLSSTYAGTNTTSMVIHITS